MCEINNRPNETIQRLQKTVVQHKDDNFQPRIELAWLGFYWQNANLSHRLENAFDYNSIPVQHHSVAFGASDIDMRFDQRKFTKIFPLYKSWLNNVSRLQFIATDVPIEQIEILPKFSALPLRAQTKKSFIYENAAVLPHVLMVGAVRQTNFTRIAKTCRRSDGFYSQTTVPLDISVSVSTLTQISTARLLSYHNNDIFIKILSLECGWLILSSISYTWLVFADSKSAKIYRNHSLFHTIQVPVSKHTVHFIFRLIHGLFTGLLER